MKNESYPNVEDREDNTNNGSWRRKVAVTVGAAVIGMGAFGGTQGNSNQPHDPNERNQEPAVGAPLEVYIEPTTSLDDDLVVSRIVPNI